MGADSSTGVDVTGAVELRELSCIGSGLVGSMLERPWAEPAADAPWHAPHAVRAAVAEGDVAITYAEPTSYSGLTTHYLWCLLSACGPTALTNASASTKGPPPHASNAARASS